MADVPKAKVVPEAPEAREGFDVVIERLRGVVEKLEGGSLGLEQSLAAFEEGVRLSRRGTEILDQAEARVEMLTREGGADVVVPFPPGPGDAADGRGEGGGNDTP